VPLLLNASILSWICSGLSLALCCVLPPFVLPVQETTWWLTCAEAHVPRSPATPSFPQTLITLMKKVSERSFRGAPRAVTDSPRAARLPRRLAFPPRWALVNSPTTFFASSSGCATSFRSASVTSGSSVPPSFDGSPTGLLATSLLTKTKAFRFLDPVLCRVFGC